MSPRVLVTGASGLLGRAIYTELSSQKCWSVVGTARSRDHGGLYQKVDLTNPDDINSLIEKFQPDVIVHAAAERRPDVMESREIASRQLNVDGTGLICQAARTLGSCWVLYISTDYVFDGKDWPYQESADRTNPINKYGQSKLDGERLCMAASKENAVLRIPVLYGDVESLAESAITILFDKVRITDHQCQMSDHERRYPTYAPDLAVVIRQMIQHHTEDNPLSGYFHWSGDEEMTKYDMAVAMAELFSLPTDHIIADKSVSGGTSRPYNAQLDCSRLPALGIGQRTPFRVGIKKCLEPWTTFGGQGAVKLHAD